jgi:hypothetical protein
VWCLRQVHRRSNLRLARTSPTRPMAGDSGRAKTVKVLTRAHKTLIFRTRPACSAAAPDAAGVPPRRTAGLRRPRRAGHVGTPRPGAGSAVGGPAVDRPDHRRAETSPPPGPRGHGQGRASASPPWPPISTCCTDGPGSDTSSPTRPPPFTHTRGQFQAARTSETDRRRPSRRRRIRGRRETARLP